METGNEVDIDVSFAVSMSLVGAVITGVLLWFVCIVLDQEWSWCRGDWWWSTGTVGSPDV